MTELPLFKASVFIQKCALERRLEDSRPGVRKSEIWHCLSRYYIITLRIQYSVEVLSITTILNVAGLSLGLLDKLNQEKRAGKLYCRLVKIGSHGKVDHVTKISGFYWFT